MQKKKARKGFLFLRRESVLPPCRAGPVCPAGTNAVFCGGTHGSRPTDRCGKPSVGDGVLDVPSARRCKAPSVGGLSAQPTGGEKNAGHLSLRQRFALTPPSQREARGDGFPRQCVPQGHLLRGAHWLAMTDFFDKLKQPCGGAFFALIFRDEPS